MDQSEVPALLARLASDEDAMRKMAVFKLQSSINDPSFADVFISSGGLPALRQLALTSTANTLAYTLQCLTRLLEVDMGWQVFEGSSGGALVERIVQLVVTQPLVNILRGAMAILVAVVGRPYTTRSEKRTPGAFGFRALKPAVAVHPQFFELVVGQLQSADHALCANALMLLNALMRDALMGDEDGKTAGTGETWPKFIKRLQDLGVVKAVYVLMQGASLQDLAHPLLEFQDVTKILLHKWHDMRVDLEVPDHRRALKALHQASGPDTTERKQERWRRLGFESETPAWEFEPMGFLGMMDLTDYVKRHEDQYQKIFQEQAAKPLHDRCPLARASLAVTAIMYEHYDVERASLDDSRTAVDASKDHDALFRPHLLQWSRLHTAGLQALSRLWTATGATLDDFDRVAELVRVLFESVLGRATRTQPIAAVEARLAACDLAELRALQMDLRAVAFDARWAPHLRQMRAELQLEALQFVREQRVRCLVAGAWFRSDAAALPWRHARLSPNRRFLHHADFAKLAAAPLSLEQLAQRGDLSVVSSVVSNVSAVPEAGAPQRLVSVTLITINAAEDGDERALLTLRPQSQSAASEWLDGLLLLLGQSPITAETNRLMTCVGEWGLRVRLLSVRSDDEDDEGGGGGVVPDRQGLGDDYFYEV